MVGLPGVQEGEGDGGVSHTDERIAAGLFFSGWNVLEICALLGWHWSEVEDAIRRLAA